MEHAKRDWSKVRRSKAPHQVSLRLTSEEHAQLEAITQKLGVSKAGYIKSAAFRQPIPKVSRRPNAVAADLRQLLGLLGKLGGNANQIARLCNSGRMSSEDATEYLRGIRDELTRMRALLLKALDVEP